MVLALGQWLSGEPDQLSAQYYATARSLFTMQILEAGTLGTVQGLLLMASFITSMSIDIRLMPQQGNYLQKMDRPNTGYNLIGIAHRMALGLGLHREIPSQVQKDIFARERRRQVFWTLYCFDSGFSITTGRPTIMHDAFIDTRLPRNIDDSVSFLLAAQAKANEIRPAFSNLQFLLRWTIRRRPPQSLNSRSWP